MSFVKVVVRRLLNEQGSGANRQPTDLEYTRMRISFAGSNLSDGP